MSRRETHDRPLVLVTGATGKTGVPVAQEMLESGYPVRALVHRNDERSERLQALGAEVVQGDFLDLASVRSAMAGVERVYFCYPPAAGLLEAATNMAVAARAEGVEALVNMSQITAREGAGSPLARQHWLSERILDWAGIGASHVNPTFFAENLYLLTGDSIATEGKMYLPFGEGRHAPVAAGDIARVVAGILKDPEPHAGARYVVTGPKTMTVAEMAEVLSEELGKAVEYVNLPLEPWRRALAGRAGFSEFLAEHLLHVAKDHRDGVFNVQTDVVERLGGGEPQSLRQFVRENRTKFLAGTPEGA